LTLKLSSVLVYRRCFSFKLRSADADVSERRTGTDVKETVVVRFQETALNLIYENAGYAVWTIIRPEVSELESGSAKNWRNRKLLVIQEVLK
jgi:hypothetical protein